MVKNCFKADQSLIVFCIIEKLTESVQCCNLPVKKAHIINHEEQLSVLSVQLESTGYEFSQSGVCQESVLVVQW